MRYQLEITSRTVIMGCRGTDNQFPKILVVIFLRSRFLYSSNTWKRKRGRKKDARHIVKLYFAKKCVLREVRSLLLRDSATHFSRTMLFPRVTSCHRWSTGRVCKTAEGWITAKRSDNGRKLNARYILKFRMSIWLIDNILKSSIFTGK